jgi:hypothetical protein
MRHCIHHERDEEELNLNQRKPNERKTVACKHSHHLISHMFTSKRRRNAKATRLAQHHVRWLDYTYLKRRDTLQVSRTLQKATNIMRPNEEVVACVRHLNGLVSIWTERLNALDLRKTMSVSNMTTLLNQLSTVFFSSSIFLRQTKRSITFSWLDEDEPDNLGEYIPMKHGCEIKLHLTLISWPIEDTLLNDPNGRKRCRLQTLIHELCHAFFLLNACRKCGIQIDHGDAWQKLAQKMEQVSSKLLGMDIDLEDNPRDM